MNLAPGSGNILQRILAVKRQEAAALAPKLRDLRAMADAQPPPRNFRTALSGQGLAVIAEIKRSSPSAGKIAPRLDPAGLAAAYAAGGANALSVLTDRTFFRGSTEDLRRARSAVAIPVMRKDFIITRAQVAESRALGADSLLLIAAALPGALLEDLLGFSRTMGMEPLVEIHTRQELARALDAGAKIIGVNRRDLRSFRIVPDLAEQLVRHLPRRILSVAESGIREPADAVTLARAGFAAVLVGEALVRHGRRRCGSFIRQLKECCS